jgi:hypothetical protein
MLIRKKAKDVGGRKKKSKEEYNVLFIYLNNC